MPEDPADAVARQISRIDSLEQFSSIIARRHDSQPNYEFELNLLGHLIYSAGDTLRATKRTIYRGESYDGPNLDLTSVIFATVNFKRNDVADIRIAGDNDSPQRKLVWRKWNNGLCHTIINRSAQPPYVRREWINSRLEAIENAVINEKANVVILGEYDFPPCEIRAQPAAYERDLTAFKQEILSLIDEQNHQVMVLAGSRHEMQVDSDQRVNFCSNTAYLFTNRLARIDQNDAITEFQKRAAAKKMGEVISVQPGITLYIYTTFVGNVCVLVCSDAYDPGVICEMILNSRPSSQQHVDYFFIPSYNQSARFLRSCQTLSYFTNSCVIYCNAHADNGRFYRLSEFFMCGERLEDWNRQDVLADQTKAEVETKAFAGYDLTTFKVDTAFAAQAIDYAKKRQSPTVRGLLTGLRT